MRLTRIPIEILFSILDHELQPFGGEVILQDRVAENRFPFGSHQQAAVPNQIEYLVAREGTGSSFPQLLPVLVEGLAGYP